MWALEKLSYWFFRGGGGKGEKMKGKEKGIKKGNRVWKEENTMRKRRGK